MNIRIKNPLSLFALFISAMYAVATVAFRDGLSPLRGGCERMSVIGFIVLFPFMLLGVITYLVVKHPGNLFSPGEYKKVEDYLLATNSDLFREKIKKEVKDLNDASIDKNDEAVENKSANVSWSSGVQQPADISPSDDTFGQIYEANEGQRIGHCFFQCGQRYGKGRMTVEAYQGIEARAIGELSRMYGISFIQGAVLGIGKRRVAVDAVGHRDNVNYVVEVKYWKNGLDAETLCQGVGRFLAQRNLFRKMGPVRMVVAVVLDRPELSLQKEVEEYVLRQSSDATLHFIYREQA